ncbi:hypothetical protein DAPPUDRAFT_241910 [Daphnia pulex]|uniref:Uncharacterized protein n=1 Tax=Daphnia pulex TaxID=6669 RepID=E9GFC9_DAPPU|nr:hypothetical protein DAPPUDRAFT_241910 [Daphnia pulex]|eukprot:EFX81617.1 hypothetical protein DAPPUDRAFT_241910 [Daphnia pulex]
MDCVTDYLTFFRNRNFFFVSPFLNPLFTLIWTPRNRAMKANSPHVTGRIDALHPIGLLLFHVSFTALRVRTTSTAAAAAGCLIVFCTEGAGGRPCRLAVIDSSFYDTKTTTTVYVDINAAK